MDIADFLSLLTNFPKVLEEIDQQVKEAKGKKRMLLLELKQNVATIELHSKDQSPVDKVIENLRIEKLEKAFNSGFNFNRFTHQTISEEATGGVPFYHSYIGWTTEELFESIYLKIVELKDIVQMDPNNPNIRKSVRLLNVFKLIKLLLVHIGENG